MKERCRTGWTAPAIAAATSLLMILFTVSSDAQAAKDKSVGQCVFCISIFTFLITYRQSAESFPAKKKPYAHT